MAGGFAKDGAVSEQIEASIDDAVGQIRRRLPTGPGLEDCEECDRPIPKKRRAAMPGVRLCVECQALADAEQKIEQGYNRRGSKGSQLR